MTDGHKTKTELLDEIQQLRQRVAALEMAGETAPATPAIDVLTKYQLLAAVARDVLLFIRARDGRILEANRAAEETYGYSRAELLNLTIYDLRAPSTRSLIATQMNQSDLQGITFETLHRRRDGQEFPVEVNSGGVTVGAERILLSIVRDITARKQAEAALRQSEALFSKTFFNTPVALVMSRLSDGTISEANDRFLELFEFDRADVIGHTSRDLNMYPDSSERAVLVERMRMQGFIRDYEMNVRARSGALRPVLLSSVLVQLNGEDCLLSTLIDITARQQIESQREAALAALRQLEERFSKTFFNAPVALSLTRVSDRHIFEVNDRFAALFGYDREDIIGHTSIELELYPDLSERTRLLEEMRHQGVIRDREVTLRTRSGALRQVLLSAVTITLNGEDCLLATLLDITERKQLETEITHLARFPGENPNPVLRLNGNGEVLYANETGRTLLQTWARTTGDEALTYWHDLAVTALTSQAQRTVDVACAGRSYAVFVTPIASAGYVNLYGQDITVRQQMETALQELNATLEDRVQARTAELQIATNRLLELDRMKDDFVARINHELRTPLANLKIFAELVEHGKPERREYYFQMHRREADRLQVLIEDLLKIRQLTSDLIELEPQATDLNQLIALHLPAWRELAARHGLTFTTDLAADLPQTFVDPELIAQVIAQLLHNAVNYTAQGTVTLCTAGRQREQRPWVTVCVSDTGPGIAPDELPHIFERFYRGRAAANYKTPGTGVGLSISRDIVSLLGGQITVESEVDRGSTFTVWLPIAPVK